MGGGSVRSWPPTSLTIDHRHKKTRIGFDDVHAAAYRNRPHSKTPPPGSVPPHYPLTDGKVEHLNRALAIEWAYKRKFTSNQDRADALASWLLHH